MRVEVFLGIFIGAITFTGSIVAYGKLAGKINSKALTLPFRHQINIARGAALPAARHPLLQRRRHLDDDPRRDHRRRDRLAPDHGDRRRRHAGRDLDAQQLLGLGGGGDRLHAVQRPPDRHRRAGRLLGRDPELHHVPGDEPQLRLGDPRRLRRRAPARRWRSRASRSPSTPTASRRRSTTRTASSSCPGYGMAVAQAQQSVSRADQAAARQGQGPCASRSIRSPAACRAT